MIQLQSSQPIGVFDSGIGGLTIVNALQQLLPGEDIIYFGDTVHFPYGEKSLPTIRSYAHTITQLLLDKGCKTILIACNSASAAMATEPQPSQCLYANVITPVVAHISQYYRDCSIGLVATQPTIQSQSYQQRIQQLNQGIQLHCQATPLLAPLVEKGFAHYPLATEVIRAYFERSGMKDIQALILACTHYPLLRQAFDQYFQQRVQILDATQIIAQHVVQLLRQQDLINPQRSGRTHFYVSDLTDAFTKSASYFFNSKIDLQYYPLWEKNSITVSS